MKYRLPIVSFALLLFTLSGHSQYVQKIYTLGGNGTSGFTGDGGLSPDAELDGPLSVALDSAGDVFFVDYYNFRVRKIAPSLFTGTITTIGGNGIMASNGDGTIATEASMVPNGIALNSHADVYISDANFSVIRKISHSTQIVSTVAGVTGYYGYNGDGGKATLATMKQPYGLAVDSKGNLFIADAGNHVIRKVDTGGIITTFAGNGLRGYSGDGFTATTAELDSPFAVCVDRWGTIYVNDYGNNCIRKIDTFSNISTYAGVAGSNGYFGDGGAATLALLNNPKGIAVDTNGNLFIADADNNVIREVNTAGIIATVVGNGTIGFGGDLGLVTGCNLDNPYGVAVDKFGGIVIADANNQRIRKTYSPWLGVNTVTNNADIHVYPNPFGCVLTLTGCAATDEVELYDVTGRQTGNAMTVSNATQDFTVSGLLPGVYFLQVRDHTGLLKAMVKLVKD